MQPRITIAAVARFPDKLGYRLKHVGRNCVCSIFSLRGFSHSTLGANS